MFETTLEKPGVTVGGEPEPEALPESIAEWVEDKLGFVPDPIQRKLLDTASARVLLNCTRQWGKSTVTAARTVYEAVKNPRSLTVVVSPSARQSGEFVRKAAEFGRRLGIKRRGDGENSMSLVFPGGGRIVGLPGNETTVRGFSAVTLMLVDEASRVSEVLYRAIRPMLAVSGGRLWMMSTPCGKRGFFWEEWAHGGEEWERVMVPATDCPRISKAFLRQEKKTMPDGWYRQEYLCEFVDAEDGVFDMGLVDRAMTRDVKPLVFR